MTGYKKLPELVFVQCCCRLIERSETARQPAPQFGSGSVIYVHAPNRCPTGRNLK